MRKPTKAFELTAYAVLVVAALAFVAIAWKSFYRITFQRPVDELIKTQEGVRASIDRIGTAIEGLTEDIYALLSLPNHELVGMASWYGGSFEGKPTASGRPLDGMKLSAAHPSLPLGTIIRVENLNNRRAVTLEINDRGPFHGSRMLDLSDRAAEALGMKKPGVCPVRITIVALPSRLSVKPSSGD